jgi:hypothetical protein
MHEIVVTGMRLCEIDRTGRADRPPRARREIDGRRRIELPREDVEPPELCAADEERIQLARLRCAEVPPLTRRPMVGTALIEQRPEILDDIRVLVVTEQDRPDTTTIRVGPEKDVHVAAADVVVDVPPVRITDVPQTIVAVCAILRAGQANRVGVVWRRKREFSSCIAGRQKRLNLGNGKPCAQRRRTRLLDETAG